MAQPRYKWLRALRFSREFSRDVKSDSRGYALVPAQYSRPACTASCTLTGVRRNPGCVLWREVVKCSPSKPCRYLPETTTSTTGGLRTHSPFPALITGVRSWLGVGKKANSVTKLVFAPACSSQEAVIVAVSSHAMHGVFYHLRFATDPLFPCRWCPCPLWCSIMCRIIDPTPVV